MLDPEVGPFPALTRTQRRPTKLGTESSTELGCPAPSHKTTRLPSPYGLELQTYLGQATVAVLGQADSLQAAELSLGRSVASFSLLVRHLLKMQSR